MGISFRIIQLNLSYTINKKIIFLLHIFNIKFIPNNKTEDETDSDTTLYVC